MPLMKHLPDVSGTLLIPVVLLSSQDPMSALYLLCLMLNFTLINWSQDSAHWVLFLSHITSSSLMALNFLGMYMISKHGSPRMIVLLSSGPWCAAMHLVYSLSYQLGVFHFPYEILELPSSSTNYHSPMLVIIKHATVYSSYLFQKAVWGISP